MPGVNITIDDDCSGCGLCEDGICFAEAIRVVNGKAQISLECRGCGRCVEICPENAIKLTINGEENIQDLLQRLDNLVDLD